MSEALQPSPQGAAVANLGNLAPLLGEFVREIFGRNREHLTVLGIDEAPPSSCEILGTFETNRERMAELIGPETRVVHVLGTGVDKFPFDLLGDRALACSRGASAVAISEFVLASMLAFEKRLPDTWLSEPPEHWNLSLLSGLSGKTLGIVGLGAIGQETVRRAMPFGMRILGYRRTDTPGPPGVELTADLKEVLTNSDHLVLAVPATPATKGLIGTAEFSLMRKGVHLVNIARGSLVDQDALRTALDDGTVALASLDVADPEPVPAGHWLYTHPQVHLSAHVSWGGPETLRRTVEMFALNVDAYWSGRPLIGLVDVAEGY
ncbi:MAG TPA: NAD(P)-dependent oxidoreductase [Acidimicrobiales bacterium]|jgi:phosphoglycerate dehydrogenase-like enzyme|nr:NAD(P)-dependent oxidoreductase [Acidimicrobiales bacterium]